MDFLEKFISFVLKKQEDGRGYNAIVWNEAGQSLFATGSNLQNLQENLQERINNNKWV